MALIKSALELALERTEGLTVDKEELRRKELFTSGRVAVAKALEDETLSFEVMVRDQEKALKKTEFSVWADGAMENLLSRILLSSDPQAQATFESVTALLDFLTHKKAGATMQKLAQLLAQYGTEVGQLKQAIGQQLGAQLRQRAQQQGANMSVWNLERDPGYLKVLAEHLEPLRAEYQQALDQAKSEVKALL